MQRSSSIAARTGSTAHCAPRAASVAVLSAKAPLLVMVLASFAGLPTAAEEPIGIHDPHHGYETRQPLDRFTRLRAALEAGEVSLDPSGELPLLRSLLAALEVPVTSQLLVTSATSLQKRLVSPRRPRAIYFNALARGLVRYLLFADEVPLPSGGIEGDGRYKADFRALRRMSRDGDSLRDFDLRTRLEVKSKALRIE